VSDTIRECLLNRGSQGLTSPVLVSDTNKS